MVVYKKCKMMVHPRDIKVGDQIEVPLDGIGTFMATAHQITDEGILFMFDDCIGRKPINSNGKNEGGFEESELAEWMQTTLYDAFPEELKKKLIYISLPSYGQIYGHDEWYKGEIDPDADEQLPLMKMKKNRVFACEDYVGWYWLRNTSKKKYHPDCFVIVCGDDVADYVCPIYFGGIRPVFLIG